MYTIRLVILAALLVLPMHTHASVSMDRTRMLADLDFIKSVFEVRYAPKGWKKNFADWDLDEKITHAKNQVLQAENLTLKEYQRIVREFMYSTKDYHVGVTFYSTEGATLPFSVQGANGKYFIVDIDRQRLSPTVYPINIGDELVAFDGRPTHEVVQDLFLEEMPNASPETDQALAELFLTVRSGAMGHKVDQGPVMVSIKSKITGETRSYQLIWQYFPEKMKAPFSLKAIDKNLFRKECVTPLYTTQKRMRHLFARETSHSLGARKSFIPSLGQVWWETPESFPFHAYMFETPDRKLIGYIRIPHYDGDDEEVALFEHVINLFQERTDALVIDQINNPGGCVFYLYALMSMLTDQPLSTPKHKMTLTQSDVFQALNLMPILQEVRSDEDAQLIFGQTFFGNPVTYQMAQFFSNYCRFIIGEWNEGRTFTKPFYLLGIDHINPHPKTRYTKPILLLVNSLDFSGGDFFPAIMQDNNRVTILGSKTAGAGGYILGTQYPNNFGIHSICFTASIAERLDSNPIENLGVTPDIPYRLTELDLQEGYVGYVDAIHAALDDILNKSS